ncbi:uncharacterized protein FIBRA_00539 [Fibroporia radiculosa]|uniref:Terpene synthase n=1 Tax=Fibroporia radiculosa TaxID=599839 RepID=J4GI11_9APHY|nr:uncharacterized protein FIBRA_00539 [Fibroporia radiculosa]CCL98540.1 predicted protein [Fibroporia radiculosa]
MSSVMHTSSITTQVAAVHEPVGTIILKDSSIASVCQAVIGRFIDEAQISFPEYTRDLELEARVKEIVHSWGNEQLLRHYVITVPTLAVTAYSHITSMDTKVLITLFTIIILAMDDPAVLDSLSFREFHQKMCMGVVQQEAGMLGELTKVLKQMWDHYSAFSANSIYVSTLRFVNASILEHDAQNEPLRRGALPFVEYKRSMSGTTEAYACFVWEKSKFPDIKEYMQAIPDAMLYVSYVNDILSFYKEELAGETGTYIHERAAICGKSAAETLNDVVDDTLAAIARARTILGEGPARDAFENFAAGRWHWATSPKISSSFEVMSKSSLSTVVSNLVRAQLGTSVSSTVTDEDLDHHVAELILKEAKQKAERYGKDGIRAYLPSGYSESNVPKANKRFLSSIIRSTDDHNKTILRAQALAAQEVRVEREEQERRERRARAEEAVAAERMRRSMGTNRRTDWAHNWDHGDKRDRKRRERSWDSGDEDDYDGERERRSGRRDREHRHRHRPKSGERHQRKDDDRRSRRSRGRDEDKGEIKSRRHRRDRRRSRSRSPDHSRERWSDDDDTQRKRRRERSREHRRDYRPSPSPSAAGPSRRHSRSSGRSSKHPATASDVDGERSNHAGEDASSRPEGGLSREDELRAQLKRKGKAKPREDSTSRRNSRSASPFKLVDGQPDTKVPLQDRTFKSASSSSRAHASAVSTPRTPPPPAASPPPLPPPSVPSKMDKYFESSYDPRLDVAPLPLPQVPSTGLIDDAEYAGWDAMLEIIRQRREDKAEKKVLERWGLDKDKSKKRKKGDDITPALWSEGGSDIMNIEYKKKGSVREWDLGKEGF